MDGRCLAVRVVLAEVPAVQSAVCARPQVAAADVQVQIVPDCGRADQMSYTPWIIQSECGQWAWTGWSWAAAFWARQYQTEEAAAQVATELLLSRMDYTAVSNEDRLRADLVPTVVRLSDGS